MNTSIEPKTRGLSRFGWAIVVSLGVLLVTSSAVKAASVVIDDTSPSDLIVVSLNDFEGGFTIDGTTVQQGLQNRQDVVLVEATHASFDFAGTWILGGPIVPTGARIIFVEKENPNVVSDILAYSYTQDTNGNGHIEGSFQSDFENNLGLLSDQIDYNAVFVENGRPYDFSNTNITASAISDAVPEPLTMFGLFAGIGSVGVYLRKRRAAA